MLRRTMVLLFCLSTLLLPACGNEAANTDIGNNDQLIENDDKEISLNPYMNIDYSNNVTSGNGMCRWYHIQKSDAQSASAEDFSEFVSKRVAPFKGVLEYVMLTFDDGTGIMFFGADPANCIYGRYAKGGISPDEALGFLVPEDDGTYSYHEFTE